MKVIQKAEYFDYMRKTSTVVNPLIASYFRRLQSMGGILLLTEPLLKKRLRVAALRPVITRLSYELCGGKNWKSIARVCALMEVHTMYLYFHNWIFDNKNNIWRKDVNFSKKNINNIIIAAAQTREILSQGIDELELPVRMKLIIHNEFSKNIQNEYHGFFLDLDMEINTLRRFKDDESFIGLYEKKSRLLSGSMYGLSGKIGGLLAEAPAKQARAVTLLGELLGTGLHISNDLGDFAPPRKMKTTFGKAYQDQLADIRDNRLTLPTYYVLCHGNKKQRADLLRLVGNNVPKTKEINLAIQALHQSGAYDYCHHYIKGFYNRAKHLLHESFSVSMKRDLYAVMLSVIRTNKFLAEVRPK